MTKIKQLAKRACYTMENSISSRGPTDVCALHCFRNVPFEEYEKVEKFLIDNGLIEESLEPDYFKLTDKGARFSYTGEI